MNIKKLLILLIFIISLNNCNDKLKPEDEKNDELIVAEITKVIDTDTRSAITEIDTNDFTFILNSDNDLIKNLEIGDILVDSTSDMAPNGYLRKITSIENNNGKITILTEQGKLSEAVPQAHIDFSSGVLNKSNLKSYHLAKGVHFSDNPVLKKTNKPNFEAFAFDFDQEINDVKISGYASLDLEFIFKFDWSFQMDWDFVEIDLFKTAVSINQVSNIKVESKSSINLNKRISIGTFYFTPWTFTLGPIPVVLVPQVELFIEMNGSISANLSTSAGESYNGEIGLQYSSDDGWDPIGESDFDTDFNPPVIFANTDFTTHVGPEAKVLLYGVAGPTMNITGFSELDATLNSPNNWDVDFYVGARAQAGVEMSILGFDLSYDVTIFEKKFNLYTLDDESFENAIYISNPTDNKSLILGIPETIQTEIIGDTPSEVQFFIDDNLVSTDSEEPFEYVWDTSESLEGNHTIVVKEIIDGNIVSQDQVTINLAKATWTAIDLSTIGINEDASINQILFVNGSIGWIFGRYYMLDNKGFILKTVDGGVNWEKIDDNVKIFKDVVALNETHLYGRWGNFVYESSGRNFSARQLYYYPGDPPPSPDSEWYYTFPDASVEGIAMNYKGELVAIGEIWHANGTTDFFIEKARTSDNDPVSYYTNETYYSKAGWFSCLTFKNHFGIAYNIGLQSSKTPVYLTTIDDGATWTEHPATFQKDLNGDDYVSDSFFFDENIGWLVGGTHYFDNGYIAKTTDGGNTFQKTKFSDLNIDIDAGNEPNTVFFISPEEGYVGFRLSTTEGYKVYHTIDGGDTWFPVKEIVTTKSINSIFFLGENFGWAAGDGNIIYKYSKE